MCGKAMYHKNLVSINSYMNYTVLNKKIIAGKWGMFQGKGAIQANVRLESLGTTWSNYSDNRGVLELEGVFEKGFYFSRTNGILRIPIIYDENYDFALITKDANPLFKTVHLRQPVILDDERDNTWIEHGKLFNLPDSQLQMINESKLQKRA